LWSHSPPLRACAKVRYVKPRLTGNAAAGNAYNVTDMASLPEAVRNAGASNVVILGAWRTRAGRAEVRAFCVPLRLFRDPYVGCRIRVLSRN